MAELACLMAEFSNGVVDGEGTDRTTRLWIPTFLPTDHFCSIVSQSSSLHLLPLLIKKNSENCQHTTNPIQLNPAEKGPRGSIQNLSFLKLT